jgi:uncharacterized membrane protein
MLAGMGTATDDPYLALADELGRLGRRLDAMGTELLRLRTAPGTQPGPGGGAAPWSRPEDAPQTGEVAPAAEVRAELVPDPVNTGPEVPGQTTPVTPSVWSQAPGYPQQGTWPQQPGSPSGYPVPWQVPGQPSAPWPGWPGQPSGVPPWQQGQAPQQPPQQARPRPGRRPFSWPSSAQLLAWTGGAVTLLGVVLLLVLAASRGWFSPQARVVAGGVLGVALVGVAVWLHRRQSGRTGALALAATGFATLYLVVAAATAYYGYLPLLPAMVAALAVAGGGLGLADRWRSQLLGSAVVVGAMVLAPALVTDWRLVALALALQLAALAVVLHGRWPVLMLIAATGPLLYGTLIGGTAASVERTPVVAVVLAVLAVGLATAVPAARRELPVVPVAVVLGAAPVPLLMAAAEIDGWDGAGLAAVAVVALVAVAMAPLERVLRVVATAAAAVALFVATQLALEGGVVTAVVLAEALVATVAAAVLRTRVMLAIGAAFGLFATFSALTWDAPLDALLAFPSEPYAGPSTTPEITGAGVSTLVLAFAIALLVAAGRVRLVRPDAVTAPLWVPVGLAGLYGATSLAVTLALLVAPDRAGFTAGHAVVTVSWTVAALVLLARGIRRPALRVAGMVLVGAAVLKLVLFDLVALDGIARVAAFLGAGLVLLAAGTRYARMVAEVGGARTQDACSGNGDESEPGRTPPPG